MAVVFGALLLVVAGTGLSGVIIERITKFDE
jgi:hypothetical protein